MIEPLLRAFYYMLIAGFGLYVGISLYIPLHHVAMALAAL